MSKQINTNIDMQGVDTIVAIPQWYINFNPSQLLASETTTEGGSLQEISLEIEGHSFLKGEVRSIEANFNAPSSTTRVKFIVSIASGTMDYYDLCEFPPTKEVADVGGLTYGFDVDIGFQDLENAGYPARPKASDRKADVKSGSGAFTIQQFFMDWTEAAISQWDKAVTVFPVDFPLAAESALPLYTKEYCSPGERGRRERARLRSQNPEPWRS